MKKIALALGTIAALAAVPAAGQTATGTVNVTGTVAGRCSVIANGAQQATFSGDIALGQLDAADGTLRNNLVTSANGTPADGKTVSARVVCTSANPTIGVSALKLKNASVTPAAAGYSNIIDYTAALKVKTAGSQTVEALYNTATNSTPVTKKLNDRIAGGTADNVEVSIFGLNASNGATSVLEQGDYKSTVTVTIEPTA